LLILTELLLLELLLADPVIALPPIVLPLTLALPLEAFCLVVLEILTSLVLLILVLFELFELIRLVEPGPVVLIDALPPPELEPPEPTLLPPLFATEILAPDRAWLAAEPVLAPPPLVLPLELAFPVLADW